jgi:hypothetical protein
MDKITNPFSPGAGSPPPALAGRDALLEQAHVLLSRVAKGKSEKSFLLTGLRGVGKTVLLNEIERLALKEKYRTVFVEAHGGKSLPALLAPHLRSLLFDLDRIAGAGNKAKQALGVLKSFVSAVHLKVGEIELGLDLEPTSGLADSGDLEVDLPALFIAVAEAAQERNIAVAIFIDEIQYFSKSELSALIMAMHKMQQRQLPLVLLGAGLSILPALAGDSKSYAERLFDFPAITALSEQDVIKALQEPVQLEEVIFTEDAVKEIYRLTEGYPYFIQEWGYQTWNYATKSPIDIEAVRHASEVVMNRLDENFFRVRFDRLTPKEKIYLRAMAEIGEGPYRSGQIAKLLNENTSALATTRANLISKGMVYSPTYGEMAFTVPLFDQFMRRAIPPRSL